MRGGAEVQGLDHTIGGRGIHDGRAHNLGHPPEILLLRQLQTAADRSQEGTREPVLQQGPRPLVPVDVSQSPPKVCKALKGLM